MQQCSFSSLKIGDKGEIKRIFTESDVIRFSELSLDTNPVHIDKDFADFFSQTIKTEQFSQYTLTESKFEVIILNTQKLHGVAMFEDNVIREPFLIIDSIYINRFLISPAVARQA